MNSTDYQLLNKTFRHKRDWTDGEPVLFDRTELYNLLFESRHAGCLAGCRDYQCRPHGETFAGEPEQTPPVDPDIPQNIRFRYPLLREGRGDGALRPRNRVVILLHGLNERSFSKYLPWACSLHEATGVPVLLFPMAFHVNRVPPSWLSAQRDIYERRLKIGGNGGAHPFNAIMSERLDAYPERFFWGAVQSYQDLVDLARRIRSGSHPHFLPDTRIDLLGYSAGGYVALMLLMENPEGLFSESRGVIFASCVPARNLNLSSPLILDPAADAVWRDLYVDGVDTRPTARMRHWFASHAEGRWMRAFFGHPRKPRSGPCPRGADSSPRGTPVPPLGRFSSPLAAQSAIPGQAPGVAGFAPRLREIAPRVVGIANRNDRVTPPAVMASTLQGPERDTGIRMVELDLGLHESPFVSADFEPPYRRLVAECLDEASYGGLFRQFIDTLASHLA